MKGTQPPPGWDDAAVRSPAGHLLQSSAWAAIRERQGWRAEFLRFGEPLPVALVLWRDLPLGRRLAYAPRGPIAPPGDSAAFAVALHGLAALAATRRALFLRVDPELAPEEAAAPLREAGFRRAPDIQPVVATLELDLRADPDALLAGLDKDTRWSLRQAERRGVRVRDARGDDDLASFHELYALTGRRAGFVTRARDYYLFVWRTLIDADLAELRLAEVDGAPVAGAMTWRCGERVVYQVGASNDAGRKSHASYALQWECILGARRRGALRYDFGGIPADPSRKDDPMHGPYLFKKGFGGRIRGFAGAHDSVPHELPYRAYRLAEPLYARALRLLAR